MNKVLFLLFIFYYQTAFTQTTEISKEEFVNEILDQVVDSSFSKYYLLNRADPCSFKRFDYDEVYQYSLNKTIPIYVLNELSKNTSEDTAEDIWQQEKLNKAVCIDTAKATSIIKPTRNILNNQSLSRKEKKKALRQAMKDWEKKSMEEKVFFNFSKPVFTDDHQYAAINIIFQCGNDFTSGWTYLFKWNKKWEVAGKIFGWQGDTIHVKG